MTSENGASRRNGVGVLYAVAGGGKRLEGVPGRDRAADAREQYWIDRVRGDREKGRGPFEVSMSTKVPVQRDAFGRTRNDPGDGFGYRMVWRTSGTETSMDWYEVVEVFATVPAKDVQGFMKSLDGHPPAGFDTEAFLAGIDFGAPGRMAQRRAADAVLCRIGRKLRHTPYRRMVAEHGYGTLVVGLPLWFGTPPRDPLRPENVLDEFMARLLVGLVEIRKHELRERDCPFRKVAVVWESSREAMEQWLARANRAVYGDPAFADLSNPVGIDMLVDVIKKLGTRAEEMPGMVFAPHVVWKRKKGRFTELPPLVAALEEMGRKAGNGIGGSALAKARGRTLGYVLCVLCLVRIHGVVGLERWVSQRILPWRRLALAAMRRRSRRLYRASVERAKARRGHGLRVDDA